ncbi:MAG TPA: hypothetical protein VK524_15960 [Polyangiaceae bacterium]|nr:hypothetical protein [Polyangiaceae bacterium]
MSAEHPEELLERARRGPLSAAELRLLRAHVAECVACRFELQLFEDGRVAGTARPADELLAARIRRSTMRRLVARSLPTVSRAAARRRRMLWLIAAALSVAALATGALVKRPNVLPEPLRDAAQPARRMLRSAWEPRLERSARPTTDGETRTLHERPEEPQRVSQNAARAAPAAADPGSAAELFSRANRARREGSAREAIALYRELQRSFPGRAEERVSRVTLGRLFLDRTGDPRAALAQFEGYLGSSGHSALRQEALVGRALALGRLGRGREELAAWNALLAAYPRTSYRERARARIEELTPHAPERVSPR